jgi:photosystem II stability/assembly factor-like uncharacterized protein
MRPAVVVLVVIGLSRFGSGEWVPIGPAGGHIQAIAIDPQDPGVLHAAYYTYPGRPEAYISTDAGAHWRPTGGSFIYSDVFAMIVDPHRPDNVYASCEGYKFWHTTDRGQTWTDIDVPAHITEVAADPFDEGILYAAGVVPAGKPVAMLSTDFCETWTVTVLDSMRGRGASCRADPLDLGTVYIGCDSGRLYRTIDGGSHWHRRDSGLPGDDIVLSIAVNRSNNAILLAGMIRGMYRSTDRGESWRFVPGPLKTEDLHFAQDDPGVAYALGYDSCEIVYLSTDTGATWIAQPHDTAMFRAKYLAVDPGNNRIAYMNAYRGVLKTTDRGAHWFYVNNGLSFAHAYTVAVNPRVQRNILVGANDHRLFQSMTLGDSWSLCNSFWCRENGMVGEMAWSPAPGGDLLYTLEGQG